MPYFGIRVVVVNDLTKPGGDEVGTKLPSDNPKMDTSTDEYPCRYRAVS
jgi:hypothetical protein